MYRDVVTKDANVEKMNDEQSESHQEWLKMVEYFKRSNIDLKRVFVTATPENVCYKYKVEHVIRLQVPHNYIGYNKIDYVCLEDTKDIKEILIEEQNRRLLAKENGAILYCVDKKISEGTTCQDETFVSVCSYVKKCVVNTYNGNGITARVLNKRKFEARLKEFIKLNNRDASLSKIKYTDISTNATKKVFNITGMAIKDFYQICKEIGMGIFVTIGMDLIARAISFVSSERSLDTVAATTMIYKPGTNLHAVGLCQAIGRITGTARPDLQRTLYAPKSVIENYLNYNQNQEQYLSEITQNEIATSDMMKKIVLKNRLTRPLDRTKLKLKPVYARNRRESEESVASSSGISRMKELIDTWWNADTIIGKILRYVYQKSAVHESDLKEYIKECGSNNQYQMYHHLVTSGKEYNLVFERLNEITKLNKAAKDYILENCV